MADREKLVKLLTLSPYGVSGYLLAAFIDKDQICGIADYLLSHGVTIREPGEWVMRGGKRYCSVCSQRACVTRDREDFWYTVGTDFCPNCGAPMKGESNV